MLDPRGISGDTVDLSEPGIVVLPGEVTSFFCPLDGVLVRCSEMLVVVSVWKLGC